MQFDLQTETPAGLESLGEVVELRELPYGELREAMNSSEGGGQMAERVFAACLHVDGEPIGWDGLNTLPGRFSGAIARGIESALRMHGMLREGAEAPKA